MNYFLTYSFLNAYVQVDPEGHANHDVIMAEVTPSDEAQGGGARLVEVL